MALRTKKTATRALIGALTLFGIASALLFPSSALAWDNCPMGLVNDPYPGACRRYVDTNGDDICDLSQPEPVQSTTTTIKPPESTTTTSLAVATTTAGEPPTGDCPLGPCAGCGACLSLSASIGIPVEADADGDETAVLTASLSGGSGTGSSDSGTTSGGGAAASESASSGSEGPSLVTHYNVSPIAIGFFLIYAISFVLYKTKRIKIHVHRKIWNVLLLATFLITGIFGLILTIQLDYALPFRIPFDLLFWHVEAGVAMTLISLFHIGWHFNYYRNLLRSCRKKTAAVRAVERAPAPRVQQPVWEAREARRAQREEERLRRLRESEPRSERRAGRPRPELGS